MFEEIFKKMMSDIREYHQMQKEQEINALMMEVEAFHIQNAIDAALETKNKEAFLILTGGCKQ